MKLKIILGCALGVCIGTSAFAVTYSSYDDANKACIEVWGTPGLGGPGNAGTGSAVICVDDTWGQVWHNNIYAKLPECTFFTPEYTPCRLKDATFRQSGCSSSGSVLCMKHNLATDFYAQDWCFHTDEVLQTAKEIGYVSMDNYDVDSPNGLEIWSWDFYVNATSGCIEDKGSGNEFFTLHINYSKPTYACRRGYYPSAQSHDMKCLQCPDDDGVPGVGYELNMDIYDCSIPPGKYQNKFGTVEYTDTCRYSK